MMAAFDVIKENIPDLEALNLNDNKLHMLDHFKLLDKKAPNLKILYMANNKVRCICAKLFFCIFFICMIFVHRFLYVQISHFKENRSLIN